MRTSLVSVGALLVIIGVILMVLGVGYFGKFEILGRSFTIDTFSLTMGGFIVFVAGLALPASRPVIIVSQKPQVKIRTVVACPSCGKFVSRKAKHCPNCGTRLKP